MRGVLGLYGAMAQEAQKIEKYICLDFAWILGAVLDGLSWIYVGLIAVVLVARPFILT